MAKLIILKLLLDYKQKFRSIAVFLLTPLKMWHPLNRSFNVTKKKVSKFS